MNVESMQYRFIFRRHGNGDTEEVEPLLQKWVPNAVFSILTVMQTTSVFANFAKALSKIVDILYTH